MSTSTNDARPRPPYDGYPYLMTRVVRRLSHYLLLPDEVDPGTLLDLALEQTRSNRLDCAVVLERGRALIVRSDLGSREAERPPYGDFPVIGRLRPAWQMPPTPRLTERLDHLNDWGDRHKGEGLLLCSGQMGGWKATAEEIARLSQPTENGIPEGLEVCPGCRGRRGVCLNPTSDFADHLIRVRCRCENWNRCAACGETLSRARLNAPRFEGRISFHPGFSGLSHRCPPDPEGHPA